MKRLSIKDIAEELGLSKTTVSWVLNGKSKDKNISKATQDRILTYAKEYNFRPNLIAQSLSSGKTNTVGLVVPNITDTFYVQVARAVEIEAEKYGYSMIYSSSEGDPARESRLIQVMTSGKVDGIILASTKKNDSDIRSLLADKFPFVLIDRYYPDLVTNTVMQDNFKGVYDMVSVMMLKGYKKIAYITTENHLIAMEDRLKAYKQAHTDAGIALNEDFIKRVNYAKMEEDVFSHIKNLIFPASQVDAIYFATHYLAIEGIKVLQELGVDIPSKIGVASYGDDLCFSVIKPRISVSLLPYQLMGELAMQILHKQMDDSECPCENIVLPSKILIRDSF